MAWGAAAIPWIMAAMTAASTVGTIWASSKQQEAMKKTRREQRALLAKAEAEAKAERARIDQLEQERLDRLRKRGSGLPPSLLTGMSGATGGAATVKPVLG